MAMVLAFLLFVVSPSVFAQDGGPTGWWTDNQGNNYYGDAPSSESNTSTDTGTSYSSSPDYSYSAPAPVDPWVQTQREAVQINDEGVKYHNAGNLEKAAEFYEKAYAKDPSNPTILGNLKNVRGTQWNEAANRYYEQGNFAEAVKHYEKALEMKPDSDVIRQNLENARNQLAQVQAQQAREAEKQQQIENVKNMVPDFAKELKPAARSTGNLELEGQKGSPSGKMNFMGAAPSGSNSRLKLEEFKNMNPLKPQLIERGTMPAGGSKTASGQAQSSVFHTGNGLMDGRGEAMGQNAQMGFDTAGTPKDGLKPVDLKGIPPSERDPVIPPEKMTPEIKQLVEERTKFRSERHLLEAELEKLEKADKRDPMAIFKAKDKISHLQDQENFTVFSINEKLTNPPEVKREKAK